MKMSPTTSDSRSSAVDNNSASRAQSANRQRAQGSHVAAAAAIDELLASEARANLQRARASTREEPMKANARITVPPARIVARPSQSPAWKAPFFSLALVVGVSTFVSAGAFAYLFLRPLATTTVSDADMRSIRESVVQLRRQVADINSDMAGSRAAIEAIRTQPADLATRVPDRANRENTSQIAKSVRPVEDRPAIALASANTPEITGTLPPAPAARTNTAPRDVIAGWHVRRAYDGAAILEGKSGVIEVVPGQDVPVIGRIQEIRNENNRWQVLTSKGVILSGR